MLGLLALLLTGLAADPTGSSPPEALGVGPTAPDCPPAAPTSARPRGARAFAERAIRFDETRDRVGGGFVIGLELGGHVRVRLDHPVVAHLDTRLTHFLGLGLGDAHGLIAGAQPLTLAGVEVALFPESVVRLGVDAMIGVAHRGLVWDAPGAALVGGLVLLLDPPGPLEARIGLLGGLVGQRRLLDVPGLVPAPGVVPELALGATW